MHHTIAVLLFLQGAVTDPTVSAFATQVTLSSIMVAALQWLKNSSWFPLLTKASDKANRVASVLLAGVGAVGVHIAWNHGSAPGQYMIQVSGLTLAGVALGAWEWIKHIALQEIIYRGTKPTTVTVPPGAVPVAKS